MKEFEDFFNKLNDYIKENELFYKLGKKGKNWVWVFDKEEHFNNEYMHYEFLLNENKISIDLHFEKRKKVAQELHDLVGDLPVYLEWKKWQKSVDSITHKNKIELNSENYIKKTIEALNELYEHTYPLLFEKAKSLKSKEYNNSMENIKSDKKYL